jgi:hypothetical protein
MSIVITVLDGGSKKILMMGDLRATTHYKYDKFINDNVEKVLKLNDTLFLGITGNLEECKNLYNSLLRLNTSISSDIIEGSKTWIKNNPNANCSYIISGKFDDGRLFAFYLDQEGIFREIYFRNDSLAYVILTHKLNLNSVFENYMNQRLPTEIAMKNTIKYASERDDSICSSYTIFSVDL